MDTSISLSLSLSLFLRCIPFVSFSSFLSAAHGETREPPLGAGGGGGRRAATRNNVEINAFSTFLDLSVVFAAAAAALAGFDGFSYGNKPGRERERERERQVEASLFAPESKASTTTTATTTELHIVCGIDRLSSLSLSLSLSLADSLIRWPGSVSSNGPRRRRVDPASFRQEEMEISG